METVLMGDGSGVAHPARTAGNDESALLLASTIESEKDGAMATMPGPCHRCGKARLSTGLCPHCEHIMCAWCYLLMPIIEYGDHRRSVHPGVELVPGGPAYLFWWQIKTDWPQRCSGCEAILNLDGTCPNDVGPRPQAHFSAKHYVTNDTPEPPDEDLPF